MTFLKGEDDISSSSWKIDQKRFRGFSFFRFFLSFSSVDLSFLSQRLFLSSGCLFPHPVTLVHIFFIPASLYIPKNISFVIGNIGASSSGISRRAANDVTSTWDVWQYRTPRIVDGARSRQFVQIVKDQKGAYESGLQNRFTWWKNVTRSDFEEGWCKVTLIIIQHSGSGNKTYDNVFHDPTGEYDTFKI